MSSVSGLSREHRIKARDLAVEAAVLTIANAPLIHYTQGPLRWQGIDEELKAWRGQFPRYADCSAMGTWWLWQGLDHFGCRDTVNGTGFRSGFTGTMLTHGKRVQHQANWLRGDLLIYGDGYPGEHVAMYLGGGFVASHGSERGPFRLRWDYRPDLYQVRRYI